MHFGEVLIAMTAIIIGGSMIILPIFALSVRYVFKPMIDSWASARQGLFSGEDRRLIERRIALLEDQVRTLERDNARLMDEAEFQMKLRG